MSAGIPLRVSGIPPRVELLMEIAITLALGVLVMGLVGSLFVASLSAIRPQVSTEHGDPLLSVHLAGRPSAGTEPAWVLYLRQPDRQGVPRQTVEAGPRGSAIVRQIRVVATGGEEVRVEQAGGAVTIEVVVRPGRERAT